MMNKTINLIITALLTITLFPASADNSKARQMKIGYTDGDLCISLGREFRVITKGALQFPASYMTRLKGNKIIKIRLGVGGNLREQQNSIFITRELDGEPVYSQTVAQLNAGWNEITLDHPLEITGEELFIGYKYISHSETVSFDGGQENNLGNWISFGEKDEGLIWNHQEGSGTLNIEAILEGDQLPQNDAVVYATFSKKYAQTDHVYPIELLVRNNAAADITSLEVTYAIDDQVSQTRTIDNLSIKSNDMARIHLGDAVMPEAGIYDLNIKLEKVNGVNDEFETDNRATIENIICKDEYTRRKVLLEQFSTAKCNNCPDAHKVFDKELKFAGDEVIRVVHHCGFYTDDLTIEESLNYLYFYNSKSVYAPGAMLDRTNLAQFGALNENYESTLGPVFNPSSDLNPKLVSQRTNSPALVTVNINHNYNPADHLLVLTVSGEIPGGNAERLKGNNICLNICLTEDSIPGAQAGVEGLYMNNHVIRKMLTKAWGDQISFTGGKYRSDEYTFTIPPEWKEKNIRIVAFIANSDPANPNNGQLFNAEESVLVSASEVSAPLAHAEAEVAVCATSDRLYIQGEYASAVIYDITGKPVQTLTQPQSELSTTALGNGLYLIKLKVDGSDIVRKFLKY